MPRLQEELKQTRPFEHVETEVFLNVARTNETLRAPLDALLKEHRLSQATYNVLRILRGARGEGLPCNEISSRLVTRVPDVTRLLDRLTTAGLVDRERDTHDRRVVLSKITPRGLELLEELDAPLIAAQKDLLGHMSRKEMETLSTLLEKARQAGL